MKTLRTDNGSIMRVADEQARDMVAGRGRWARKGDYSYCSKEEWKKEVRGPIKTKPEVKNEVAS